MDPTILDGVDDLINYEIFKLNVFLPLINRAACKQKFHQTFSIHGEIL